MKTPLVVHRELLVGRVRIRLVVRPDKHWKDKKPEPSKDDQPRSSERQLTGLYLRYGWHFGGNF
jgi:hypothetical protein